MTESRLCKITQPYVDLVVCLPISIDFQTSDISYSLVSTSGGAKIVVLQGCQAFVDIKCGWPLSPPCDQQGKI